MDATLARQKIHGLVDTIPDEELDRIWQILRSNEDEPFVIETDLTDEEYALIAEGMAEYERDPSSFTSWQEVKRQAGLL